MTKTRFDFRSVLVALSASMMLAACGGGGSVSIDSTPTPATGTLRVALTDAPACGFDQVNVTIDRVRMHTSSGAGDNDAGWSEIVLNPAKKIDLLTLQNGVMAELGQATLPAGTYQQIRLVLAPNGGGSPANSVKPTGGAETPMDTPSAMQSGLKLINPFTVQAGQLTDIVLDFDACKSVVARGNGSFSLKPVMAMVPRTLTAITGYVETGVTNVTVSAQKNGIVYRATQPNANGQFILAPIDPATGPYDVVVVAPARTTAVITAVPVTKDQTTTVNAVGSAVTLPVSQTSTAAGKVGPTGANGATSTGLVRALQKIGAADTAKVEVAHVNVNPTTGDYSLTLPTAAPRVVAYVSPPPTTLGLTAYSASAGKYLLEASATGFAPKLGSEITLPATGQDFTLNPAP